jgi:hypothetical protein
MFTANPFTSGSPVSAKIIPVRPASAEPAASPAEAVLPSRRPLGRYLPSRRPLGRYLPSRRTLGRGNPSQRTLGRFSPSRRPLGTASGSRIDIPVGRHRAGPPGSLKGEGRHDQLGIIAGHLERTRTRRSVPARLAAGGYGLVCAGTVTARGERVTLTAGGTGDPAARLEAGRRAVLVHISAATLHQVLAAG